MDRPGRGNQPALKVDLVLLRNAAAPPQRFVVREKDLHQLPHVLERTVYDGGTQLGAVAPLGGEQPDAYLLFSDGISTFGSDEPKPLGCRYTSFRPMPRPIGPSCGVAMVNGGQFFDLSAISDGEVLAALKAPPPLVLLAAAAAAGEAEMFPAPPWPLSEEVSLIG